MMSTHPVLHLNRRQAAQLAAHCRAYRSHLWRCLPPGPERNQVLRRIQGLQGRLELLQEQGQMDMTLSLSMEEGTSLRRLFPVLMRQHSAAPPSAERTEMLGELAGLRLLVERALRQRQAL